MDGLRSHLQRAATGEDGGHRCVYVVGEDVLSALLLKVSEDSGSHHFIATPADAVVSLSRNGPLTQFLEAIREQPQSDALQGCIFSISGFPRTRMCTNDDPDVPTRDEVASAIARTGAHLGTGAMVQGVTTHLVCLHRCGAKYDAATRWGFSTIQVVEWPWLLHVLQRGNVPPPSAVSQGPGEVASQFDFYALTQQPPPPMQHDDDTAAAAASSCTAVPSSCSSSPESKSKVSSDDASNDVDGARRKRAKQQHEQRPVRFAFGGGRHDDSKMELAKAQLHALGADVAWPAAAPRFDDAAAGLCTHLVMFGGELKRTEKFLCAAAAGRWVLTPEYVRASHATGRLLPFEDYEVGAGGAHHPLAAAATFRRTQREAGLPLVFAGKHVVIVGTTAPPPDILVAVVESGGGTAAAVATAAELAPNVAATAYVAVTTRGVDALNAPVVTPAYILDSVCATTDVELELASYMAPS